MASLQNRAQTSKPGTPKPQNLTTWEALKGETSDLHSFGPFHIKLCSTKPKSVASLQNRTPLALPWQITGVIYLGLPPLAWGLPL